MENKKLEELEELKAKVLEWSGLPLVGGNFEELQLELEAIRDSLSNEISDKERIFNAILRDIFDGDY